MGSIRISPPRGSQDRREQNVHLSPRRSRATDESDRKTLPSISDLLPEMGSSGQSPYRSSPPHTHHFTPPNSNKPSPTNPSFPPRREDYSLPYHAGPQDRGPPANLSSSGWHDRHPHSTISSGSPYGTPSFPSHHTPPYPPPSVGTPGTRPREEDYRTGLPPPPPPRFVSDPHRNPPSYPRPKEHAREEGRYEASHWQEGSSNQYAPYSPAGSREAPPRPHEARAAPSGAPSSAGYPPSEGYSQHYSQLPPIQYEREEPPRKRRGNLPRWITDLLKAWFLEHIAHPYPSEQEKNELCMQTGCSMTQISNWFINARRRRTPELTRQAEAERRLRDHAGRSSSNSE